MPGPTAPCARAALDYSVVDLGVFSAQCLGNRRPVLWSAKSYGVGQATRTVVLPRIGAQDPFQRFVQASYGFYSLAASLSAAAGGGGGQLSLLRYHASMPRPLNERQSLELKRAELPAQLASYQQELAAGQADKTRRECLVWPIRRAEKRMAEVEARLAES